MFHVLTARFEGFVATSVCRGLCFVGIHWHAIIAVATVAPSSAPPASAAAAVVVVLCFAMVGVALRILFLVSLIGGFVRKMLGSSFLQWGIDAGLKRFVIARRYRFALFVVAPSSAPPPTPALAAAFACFGLTLVGLVVFSSRLDFGLGRFSRVCIFGGVILVRDVVVRLVLNGRSVTSALRCDGPRLLDRVNELAFFDDEGLLRADRGIGCYSDRDLEALLQIPKMATLVVENIERDVRIGAHNKIVCACAQQRLVNDAQQLKRK
jgi:hypothetical protein